jgi:hypothetical protein
MIKQSALMTNGRHQGRTRRSFCVQDILEWAFRIECVQLELTETRSPEERGLGFGVEYVLIQRAILGCKVDGGGSSDAHWDAEIIAATVANLPDAVGGIRMGIWIAELARAGLTPDWMPGAVSRCVPSEWRQTKHGQRAQSQVCGEHTVRSRGRVRLIEVRCCPVKYDPHPGIIDAARKSYADWCAALVHVRDALEAGKMLRDHVVEERLPPAQPWARRSKARPEVINHQPRVQT